MGDNYTFFINTNLDDYIGEWITIVENEIVAHGKDIKRIYKETKEKYPGKRICITRVPDEENCIF